LKALKADAAAYKVKRDELEQRLSKEQRTLLEIEDQYRDQIKERNELLMTIYKDVEIVLGVNTTPVSSYRLTLVTI